MDEGLLYETTRVIVWRGYVVGFRFLLRKVRMEDKTTIHIADQKSMTKEFS